MFKMWAMTDGDNFELTRAEMNLEAMRRIAALDPRKAARLRAAMNAEARKISDIQTRYE